PKQFSRDGLTHAVMQHIVIDDQSFALADKKTFHNCLVQMRPSTKSNDLCSAYDVSTHLHNEFVDWMHKLK
ncbi:hypothetical protein JOM56_014519, partial [Amanita muscaria]